MQFLFNVRNYKNVGVFINRELLTVEVCLVYEFYP